MRPWILTGFVLTLAALPARAHFILVSPARAENYLSVRSCQAEPGGQCVPRQRAWERGNVSDELTEILLASPWLIVTIP
jgi:hypothetical protein